MRCPFGLVHTKSISSACSCPTYTLISQPDEVLIDDVFYHFLYVAFASATGNGIPDAVVFEIISVIGFKHSLAVNVVSIYFVQNVCLTKKRDIVDDNRGSNRISLRFHVFCYTVGRD